MLQIEFMNKDPFEKTKSSPVISYCITGEPVAQDLTLKIDSTIYASGTEVRLDEGPHNFECTASNAELNTAVAWDFQGNSVAADTIRTLFKGGLQDIDSTIHNHEIRRDHCGIFVRCSVISSCNPTVVTGSPAVSVLLNVVSK